MITGPVLITAWHRENRAAHMSVFYTSGAIAGFLMPLAANALSEISVQLCWGVFFFEAFLALLLGAFVTAEKTGGGKPRRRCRQGGKKQERKESQTWRDAAGREDFIRCFFRRLYVG